jgi:hypothetical protein
MIKFVALANSAPRYGPVLINQETEDAVCFCGQWLPKRSDFRNYFDSAEEARDFLIDDAETLLEAATKTLDDAEKALEEAKARVLNCEARVVRARSMLPPE